MAPPTSPSPTALICSDTQMHNFVSLRPPGYTHTRSRRKIQLSIIQSLTSCRLLSWATSIVFSVRLNPLPPPKTSWFQGWGSSKCKLLLLLWFQKTIWEKWPVSHGHQFQNPHSVMREARWRIASGAQHNVTPVVHSEEGKASAEVNKWCLYFLNLHPTISRALAWMFMCLIKNIKKCLAVLFPSTVVLSTWV